MAKVDNAKETADLRDAPLFYVPKTTLLIYYNILQLNEVAYFTSKLNLKNKIMNTEKTLIENESQPSCLGVVISWYRKNQDTLLLVGIGLLFQLIFFIGVIISGSCI